ncbi:hypothetical protein NHH73_24945 [Oxalobacteraceae bacterium OTU3CINTB1]|nr:hypothetical protein NHH73_24945 [Oxalobacteraceae bacterium OTU3CINTB1]
MAKSNTAAAPAAPAPTFADPEVAPEPVAEPVANTTPGAPPTVKARVLVAGPHGECNDVVELDAELAATLAGTIDTDPAAVAYAESLTKE